MDLVTSIAKQAHEVNREYCRTLGDFSQPTWEDAPGWQKDSAIAGVVAHLKDPNMTAEQSHESWMAQKVADGWVWGDVKDVEKKQHPCMLPYDQLPVEQRFKDFLFKSVVDANRPESYTLSTNDAELIRKFFNYHLPKPDQLPRYDKIRSTAALMATVILECVPECADRTAAIRKLRECVMTANAGIACEE